MYERPRGIERVTQVEADWRMGTKAMVMKSIPVDDMNVIVFAIRGTHTFMDWAVNLQSSPTSAQQFLVRGLHEKMTLADHVRMILEISVTLDFSQLPEG